MGGKIDNNHYILTSLKYQNIGENIKTSHEEGPKEVPGKEELEKELKALEGKVKSTQSLSKPS
ncbi:MAG: hypothetical protein QFX33_00150 [Candidatus Nezhaarchaeota archaeon]|nr:hypothetical protein [Candidatus Nezhaarchaeota archaeon]